MKDPPNIVLVAAMQQCRPGFSVGAFRKVLCLPRSSVSKMNVFLTLSLKVFTCMELGIWEMRPSKFRDYRIVVIEEGL